MKLYKTITTIVATIMLCISCTDQHFISDENERNTIISDYESRRDTLKYQNIFEDLNKMELSVEQREALMFLYAYMPLADIADHPSEYFLENINCAFTARKEMPWGKDIPEREFRHFVVPIRVNNENLDNSRKIFYEELKNRVKGLSLYEAVLEVNHWCHEKVTYQPSDARTSSPLASVKTAYGRCGEESTFTVAALRSVGIPARQVYTPRWAHTDDNHAWVEAWVDGKWHFLGACEPEPVLDLAWFNAPASRGMLMHTKVFGRYTGPEEVMYRTPRYTEINVIDNYAPTARLDVSIKDTEDRPVENAKVEFKVYNYGEFYSVATKNTDKNGNTFLTAGKGDMVVWASKNGEYGYAKVSFGKDKHIDIKLRKQENKSYSKDFNIVPPIEGTNIPEVTNEQRIENDRRFAQEDSIRRAYEATFYTQEKGLEFAEKYKLSPATDVAKILIASRGNHDVITEFLSSLNTNEAKQGGIDLLQQISEKDLRAMHKCILEVTERIDQMKFNTAVSSLMTYVNYMSSLEKVPAELYLTLLKLMSPFTPHLAEEMWARMGKNTLIITESWPQGDAKLAQDDVVTIAVQVCGKLRGTIEMPKDAPKEELEKAALNMENVKRQLEGQEVVKVIVVPNKIVNIVAKAVAA